MIRVWPWFAGIKEGPAYNESVHRISTNSIQISERTEQNKLLKSFQHVLSTKIIFGQPENTNNRNDGEYKLLTSSVFPWLDLPIGGWRNPVIVVNDIGNQIVSRARVGILNFGVSGQELSQIHVANRKVHDRGILLDEEVVFRESFVADDEVRRQFGEFEPLQRGIAVRLVLFLRDSVEFGHDREEGDLGNDVLLNVIFK